MKIEDKLKEVWKEIEFEGGFELASFGTTYFMKGAKWAQDEIIRRVAEIKKEAKALGLSESEFADALRQWAQIWANSFK